MKKMKPIKVLGGIAMVVGFLCTAVSEWVTAKENKDYIDEEMDKRFAELKNGKES